MDDSRNSGIGAVNSIHDQLMEWLFELALPLWDEHGVDRSEGGFHEHLNSDSRPPRRPERGGVRRGRVVARQIYVFDVARRLGWRSPRTDPVNHGCDYLFAHLHQGDGAFHTAVHEASGERADGFSLYEQAFYLFVLARLMSESAERHPIERTALLCLRRLRRDFGRQDGGFEESAPPSLPLRSNPHMHLLEAALAWIEASAEADRGTWVHLAGELVALALTRFADAGTGAIPECFNADWQGLEYADDRGHVIEPGHQFEWAWLLMRWLASGHCPEARRPACARAAERLIDIGELSGVDSVRGVVINEIWGDLSVKDPAARLWPQTERLKAWCSVLARASSAADIAHACARIQAAARGLARFLPQDLGGMWHETLGADGAFAKGPSKASSFYHIVSAIDVLHQTLGRHFESVPYSAPEPSASMSGSLDTS